MENTKEVEVVLAEDSTPDAWHAKLTAGTKAFEINRRSQVINIEDTALGTTLQLALQAPDNTLQRSATQLKNAYTRAIETYPPWRDLLDYRHRIAIAVACLWLITELLIFAIAGWFMQNSQRLTQAFNATYSITCLGLSYFLHFHYLK